MLPKFLTPYLVLGRLPQTKLGMVVTSAMGISTVAIATVLPAPSAQAADLTYDLSLTLSNFQLQTSSLLPSPFGGIDYAQPANPPLSITQQITVPDNDEAYLDGVLDWSGLLSYASGVPEPSLQAILTQIALTPLNNAANLGSGSIFLQNDATQFGAFTLTAVGVELTDAAKGIIGQCKSVDCGFNGSFGVKGLSAANPFPQFFQASGQFSGTTEAYSTLASANFLSSSVAPASGTAPAAVPSPSLLGGVVLFGWRVWQRRGFHGRGAEA